VTALSQPQPTVYEPAGEEASVTADAVDQGDVSATAGLVDVEVDRRSAMA
jgi:hypothetical protein